MVIDTRIYELVMRLVSKEPEWREYVKQNDDVLRYCGYRTLHMEFPLISEAVYIPMLNWCLDAYIYTADEKYEDKISTYTLNVSKLAAGCVLYMKKLMLGEIS